jgi:hypothetical protein
MLMIRDGAVDLATRRGLQPDLKRWESREVTMKIIRNATQRPLRVPLPQGKVLHLGPKQTGKVGDHLEHPPLKKMIDAGEIEVVGDGRQEEGGPQPPSGETARGSTHGHAPNRIVHPSGDR